MEEKGARISWLLWLSFLYWERKQMFHQKGTPHGFDEKILALQATDSGPNLVRSSGATVTASTLPHPLFRALRPGTSPRGSWLRLSYFGSLIPVRELGISQPQPLGWVWGSCGPRGGLSTDTVKLRWQEAQAAKGSEVNGLALFDKELENFRGHL